MKYWYKFYFEECPLCGKSDSYKVRQYSEKPIDRNNRFVYSYMSCGCQY